MRTGNNIYMYSRQILFNRDFAFGKKHCTFLNSETALCSIFKRYSVTMDTPMSPISVPSPRESPSYIPKSQPSSLSPGRDLPKMTPSKCTSSTPASRHAADDSLATNLTSAKHLQRSVKSERRKDTARRRLMGTMYTKQNEVTRSFTFVAGERPQTDLKFPTVSHANLKTTDSGMPHSKCNAMQNSHLRDYRPKSDTSKDKVKSGAHLHERRVTSVKSRSKKVSLPEIIMEFNLEASMAVNSRQDYLLSRADTEEDSRALGDPYEEFLSKPTYAVHNPCRAKYRPVTPGLLESLNKTKMPSKLKTEQWVRSIQNDRKSYCSNTYRIGNLDNSNLATPNWIYEYR